MISTSYKSPSGTSYHGVTIYTSANTFLEMFPEVNKGECDDKVRYDFVLETSDGEVFTVYDMKECYFHPDEFIHFHIGAMSEFTALKAKFELLTQIKEHNDRKNRK